MKRKNILIQIVCFLLVFFETCPVFSQDSSKDGVKNLDQTILGIWRVDLPEQKSRLEPENMEKLSQLDGEKQEQEWIKTDSRVYNFEEDGAFQLSWVEEGSAMEVRGIWTFDPATQVLKLTTKRGTTDFLVKMSGNKAVWTPFSRSEEYFSILYLKRLGR